MSLFWTHVLKLEAYGRQLVSSHLALRYHLAMNANRMLSYCKSAATPLRSRGRERLLLTPDIVSVTLRFFSDDMNVRCTKPQASG